MLPAHPTYGTVAHPIRASSLPLLLKCPMRIALQLRGDLTDSSGIAADTGSAVHAAVEAWHLSKDVAKAMKEVQRRLATFPKADLKETLLFATPYANDPRNAEAEVVASERGVTFTLPPDANDPCGPIHFTGRFDQVRRERDDRLYLWDLKTGGDDGWVVLHEAALQLSAYCIGATALLGEEVHPGGIIWPRGYRRRGAALPDPPGVFFHASWELAECMPLLAGVRQAVAAIRRGAPTINPGAHCGYCPAKGVSGCLSLLRA